MTQIWLVDPFTQVKSAEHMAKIIQHKSQISALKLISKCIKRLNIKYSQIRNFLDYRVQNVPENSSKTSPLGGVSKQAKRFDRP